MTSISLHRCRFVDYTPPQITSIVFSHPSTPSSAYPPPSTLRAAIGRANGSIEIWNPLSGSWFHETTLQGGKDRSIEGLTWVQDHDAAGKGSLRLFSIGYSSVVTEWNLAEGRPRVHLDCNGGVIWSIAAQPRTHSSEVAEDDEDPAQKIVVGTDDGTVVLLSTAGGPGGLSYVKKLMRAGTLKSRVLSLTWQDRFTVVAGMADSTIRVWDIRSGRSVSRMSLNKEKGREVLVWSVKALPNGDIVSADSRGEVCFWDGKNYALRQRIKSHDGDCLALEIGGINGDTVISGGVDMRTVVYKHIGSVRRWGQVARRRFHKHDVRAMAAYECGKFSVILSGGVDMTPIVIPLRQFGAENHLTLPAIPQTPVVATVPQSRLMMSWWEREIKIWRIDELDSGQRRDEMYLFPGEAEERGRKLLSRIMLENEENITSAAITPLHENRGHILAISTIAHIKLFHLRPAKSSSSSEALRVRKINLPTSLILETAVEELDSDEEEDDIDLAVEGARLVKFSPDGKWLTVITPASRILMVEIVVLDNGRQMRVDVGDKVLELHRQERRRTAGALKQALHNAQQISKKGKKKRRAEDGSLDGYEQTINRAVFSSESNIFAVADLRGWLDTFVFDEGSWTYNIKSITLPKLSSAMVALEFRPVVSPPVAPPNLITEDTLKGVVLSESEDHLTITAEDTLEEVVLSESEDHLTVTTEDTFEEVVFRVPEDRLLAITAKDHHIFEFHVLQGRLSDWSRHNTPAEKLPHDFRLQKDRAAGVVWEVSAEKERIWVWASSWVWMFDLRQNLPTPEGVEVHAEAVGGKRKRKRGAGETLARFADKGESGAGDKVLAGQSRGLLAMPKKSEKPSTPALDLGEDDEDDEDDEDTLGLVHSDNSNTDDEDDKEDTEATDKKQTGYYAGNKPYWKTNRYRNLMAFLPIGGKVTPVGRRRRRRIGAVEAKWGQKIDGVEMVAVERPSWDIEMPPRFYTGTGFGNAV